MTTLNNVTTVGAGVMGSQVAWMAAWHGETVTVFDAFEEGLERGKGFHDTYAKHFMEKRGATQEEGEGFYKYPNPEFENEDLLEARV